MPFVLFETEDGKPVDCRGIVIGRLLEIEADWLSQRWL
jgi:hypothetical protein